MKMKEKCERQMVLVAATSSSFTHLQVCSSHSGVLVAASHLGENAHRDDLLDYYDYYFYCYGY